MTTRKRNIIEISGGGDCVYALDDNREVWMMYYKDATWTKLPPLPDEELDSEAFKIRPTPLPNSGFAPYETDPEVDKAKQAFKKDYDSAKSVHKVRIITNEKI